MILIVVVSLLILWILVMAFKFYRRAAWDEPAESSPDFGQMRKKEADLLHVQDVLEEACQSGKLSRVVLDEFARYADQEITQMKAVKASWDSRRSASKPD